jgi:hypothetical protein
MGRKTILSGRHGHQIEGAPTPSPLDTGFEAGLGGADVCWLERIDVTAGYGLVGGHDLWPVFRVVRLLGLCFQYTVQLVDPIWPAFVSAVMIRTHSDFPALLAFHVWEGPVHQLIPSMIRKTHVPRPGRILTQEV